MFIDQLIRLASKDDTKIIKTENHPFDLMTRGQFNHDMFPIPPDTIEKLILDINLSLHHAMAPFRPKRI